MITAYEVSKNPGAVHGRRQLLFCMPGGGGMFEWIADRELVYGKLCCAFSETNDMLGVANKL